jgi:hypothetical protein
MTKEDILTVQEICEILKIKSNTLHSKRWRSISNIPVFRQGKRLFSLKKEFWNWYMERAVI